MHRPALLLAMTLTAACSSPTPPSPSTPEDSGTPTTATDTSDTGSTASLPPIQSLSDQADVVFLGTVPDRYAGTSLTTADLDEDGIDDLLVGAPGPISFGYGYADRGELFLLSGTSGLSGSWQPTGSVLGEALDDVGRLVDVGDLGAGAPTVVLPIEGDDFTGQVRLLHGTLAGQDPRSLPGVNGDLTQRLRGGKVVPDVDGDGRADLALIGDLVTNLVDPVDEKRILLFLEPPTSFVHHSAADAILAEDSHGVGTSLWNEPFPAGDLDGDGVEEWLIGDFDHPGAGRVWWCDAPSTGTVRLEAVARGWWTGESDGGGTGKELSTGGDATGDGGTDWVVGAWTESVDDYRAGRAYLMSGPPSGPDVPIVNEAAAVIVGDTANAWLGSAVELGLDADGDGQNDLLVGRPFSPYLASEPGQVLLYLAPLSGTLEVADADARWVGDVDDRYLGATLAIGDWNGDGTEDLAIGSSWTGHAAEGRAMVFFGPLL